MPKLSLSRRDAITAAAAAIAAIALPGRVAAARAGGKFEISRTPAEWRRRLGSARYAILRQGGTERPGSSPLDKENRRGTFVCAGCALPLFSSAAKFESGTGWPSFFRALPNAVATREDSSLGTPRTEAICRRCGGHLGHLFKDGPKPTGLRYCMNGLALRFRAAS
jgi:peptide-methionine (R)-S-oxide reductase